MRRQLSLTLPVLACALLLAACVTVNESPNDIGTATSVVLDPDEVLLLDETYFTAVDGSDAIAAPGVYRVDTAEDGALRLTPVGGGDDLVVAAEASGHGEPVASPEATVVFGDEPSEGHVILLLPGGSSREAVGDAYGVRPRAGGSRKLAPDKLRRQRNSAAKAALTVTSPSKGESWSPGSRQQITWTMNGVKARKVKLALFQGKKLVVSLARAAPNIRKFVWKIPRRLPGDGNAPYTVLVATVDNTAHDYSDPFTLGQPATSAVPQAQTVQPGGPRPGKPMPIPPSRQRPSRPTGQWADVPTQIEIEGVIQAEMFVITGPGIQIERVSGFRPDGRSHDRPGFPKGNPLVLDAEGEAVETMKTYFDTYFSNPEQVSRKSGSVIVRNLARDELFRWNFFEMAPAKAYGPGANGRTRFTLVSKFPLGNTHPGWELGNADPFGQDGSYNPASDNPVEIEGVTTGSFFPVVEDDTANRTLTLTYDMDEGKGIFPFVKSTYKGEGQKKALSVIEWVNNQEVSRRNYFECFPLSYEQFTGFELDIKIRARVVLSYDFAEDG